MTKGEFLGDPKTPIPDLSVRVKGGAIGVVELGVVGVDAVE